MRSSNLALIQLVAVALSTWTACLAANATGQGIDTPRSTRALSPEAASRCQTYGHMISSEPLPFSQLVVTGGTRPGLLEIRYEVLSLFQPLSTRETFVKAEFPMSTSHSPPDAARKPHSSFNSATTDHSVNVSERPGRQNPVSGVLQATYLTETTASENEPRRSLRQELPRENPANTPVLYTKQDGQDLPNPYVPGYPESARHASLSTPADVKLISDNPRSQPSLGSTETDSATRAKGDTPANSITPIANDPNPSQEGERRGDRQPEPTPTTKPTTETSRTPIELPPSQRASAGADPASPSGGPIPAPPRHSSPLPSSAAILMLGLILLLLGLIGWIAGKKTKLPFGLLSAEVFEILGRAPITPRFSVQLIRCGDRLLLVAITPDTISTLSEITDPEEVTRLLALCRGTNPKGISESFRQIFEQMTRSKNLPS